MPSAAFFSDTGFELDRTLENVNRLKAAMPFPVVTIPPGPRQSALVPLFTHGNGREGQLRRQCTREWKIRPVARGIRKFLEMPRRGRPARGFFSELWLGFSSDECSRCKDGKSWLRPRWPLIELGIDRADCARLILSAGWELPPRSACVFCPFRSNHEFAAMKAQDQSGWEMAVRWDSENRRVRGIETDCYVHRTLRPLSSVAEIGGPDGTNHFENVCEGNCGT